MWAGTGMLCLIRWKCVGESVMHPETSEGGNEEAVMLIMVCVCVCVQELV